MIILRKNTKGAFMKIDALEYKFKNKRIKMKFNKESIDDNNTYSLILGNNGSGKSTLFEAIINYYFPDYSSYDFDTKIFSEDKEQLKKIILSTYSPYDRIRFLKNNKVNRPASSSNSQTEEDIQENNSVEFIYPNHTLDKLVGMACSSYYKCKINDKEYFRKVEKQISELLDISDDFIYLLMENLNQLEIKRIENISKSSVKSKTLELIKTRRKYLDDDFLTDIDRFYILLEEKNTFINSLSLIVSSNTNNSTASLRMQLHRIFNKCSEEKEGFKENFTNEYNNYVKRLSDSFFSYNNPIVESLINSISEATSRVLEKLEDFIRKYNISQSYLNLLPTFQDFDSLNIYFILVHLKELYKNIKSQYGKEITFNEITKQLVTIQDIYYFYEREHSFCDKKNIEMLINLDFDILESVDIFLINDLILKKENEFTPLSMFSSGEFSLFIRIMELSLYIEKDSLILIDEPEIHLNPNWINKYYYILKNCFNNMNCHFIMASQSPLIVNMFHTSEINYLTSRDKEDGVSTINNETFVSSIDNILKYVFNLEYDDNPLINYELKKIRELALDNLFLAIQEIDKIAFGTVRFKISNEILTEKNIEVFKKIINEDIEKNEHQL